MAEKARHGHEIQLKKFSHQRIEYRLMKDLNDKGPFSPIQNNSIVIGADHTALAIRYEYKNKHDDGFQIQEITGDVRLYGYQFRMERIQGTLWCINVFKIEKHNITNGDKDSGHDSDMEPPEPPLP